MLALIVFEPENLTPCGPITLFRSLGELHYGIYSNIDRTRQLFPNADLGLWVRPLLAADQQNRFSDLPVNATAESGTIFLNAAFPAWLYPQAIEVLTSQNIAAVTLNQRLLAAKSAKQLTCVPNFQQTLAGNSQLELEPDTDAEAPLWIWDYLDLIGPGLEHDLELWKSSNDYLPRLSPDLSTINDRHILIHNTAQISKFVHLDASHGPIVIDEDAQVNSFCSLEGPLYLGKRSVLKPATSIRHSSIGAVCNLGGEIKGSIIHAHSNKSHDGFLGDSILGSWINLGAGTITSNLKNNYQPVRVSWDGNNYETGRQFLGSVIGDHSKTAIGVRLNTGTFIGAFCNVFQADFPPRAIPSFSWGNGTYELNKAILTARRVMARRNQELSSEQEYLIRQLASDSSTFTHF